MGNINCADLNVANGNHAKFIFSLVKPSNYRNVRTFSAFFLFFIFGFHNAKAQFVKHSYKFNNTLSAAQPECGPDLVTSRSLGNCLTDSVPGKFVTDTLPFCSTGRTVYHTNLYWGLKYPNSSGYLSTTYTISLYVKNTNWAPDQWARIIDFDSTSTNDVGIYFEKESLPAVDYCLWFWPVSRMGACPNFIDSTYYLLTFTRNGATGILDTYVNNSLFASFNDSTNKYVAKTGNPIFIYRDDPYYPCESAEANIAYLSFSNQYSSPAAITSVYNNLCSDTIIRSADFNLSTPISCDTNKNVTITYAGNIIPPGTNYIFNWNWDGGNLLSGSGMGPFVVRWDTPGLKNIALSIAGSACTVPLQVVKTITVENLNINTLVIPARCNVPNGLIIATAKGGAQPYQYSLDGLNYQISDTFTVSPGHYSISVKDANNCTANTSSDVQIIDDLTLQIRSDTSVCPGEPVKLSTNSNGTEFFWQPSATLDNSKIKDPVAKPLLTSEYIVYATYGTCTKYDTVKVTVTKPPVASVTTRSADCSANASGSIAVNVTGGASPYRYSLDGITFQNQATFAVAAGEYTLFVKDANNCMATAAATIGSVTDISLQASSDTSICQGQTVTLTTSSNATNFSWQPSAGLNDPQSKSPVANPMVSTDYIVTAIYGNCTKKDTVKVTVTPAITVITSADTVTIANTPVQLNAFSPQLTGAAGVSYLWTPAIGLNNQNIANPIAFLKTNQSYSVEIKSLQGCKGSSTVKIEVLGKPDIYVPTAFTPNNDGTNDILKPIGVGIQSLKYFKVFNRWGKIVYSTSMLNQGWNGNVQGINQPTGTYVWLVEGVTIHGQVIHKKGIAVLIR